MNTPNFSGPNGQDPVRAIELVANAAQVTVGDALFGGQILRTRIIQRTAQGRDSAGSGFQSYTPAYRKQKIKKLGSADPVNLFGFRDPQSHMMNSMLVKSGSSQLGTDPFSMMLTGGTERATNVEIGFYGTESVRARVHNEGTGRMPRRHFFDVNAEDLQLVAHAIGERIMGRLKNG